MNVLYDIMSLLMRYYLPRVFLSFVNAYQQSKATKKTNGTKEINQKL